MSLIMVLIRLYIISVGGWVYQLLNLVHALANIHILKYFLSFGFTTFFLFSYCVVWLGGLFLYWIVSFLSCLHYVLFCLNDIPGFGYNMPFCTANSYINNVDTSGDWKYLDFLSRGIWSTYSILKIYS